MQRYNYTRDFIAHKVVIEQHMNMQSPQLSLMTKDMYEKHVKSFGIHMV